jgi:mRNA interferase RelE/StbE
MNRVNAAILALADDPYPPGSRKLHGEEDLYRVRIGDYRILYRVENERLVVLVVNIGHRRDIYRSL